MCCYGRQKKVGPKQTEVTCDRDVHTFCRMISILAAVLPVSYNSCGVRGTLEITTPGKKVNRITGYF